MTKGFEFSSGAGTLTFRDGVRDALVAPDGTLINLLPDEFVLTNRDEDWPDVPKDRIFYHEWSMLRVGAFDIRFAEIGTCQISALPQEWSETVVLGDAPDDTDIFAYIIKLQRTVAPSHNWLNSIAISKMVPENVQLAGTGSILLEASLGFARAMSIYIDNAPLSPTYRKLVLFKQQSIGTAPGGYGDKPGNPGGEPASYALTGWSNGPPPRTGGELVAGTTQGWPLYFPGTNTAPHYRSYSNVSVDPGFGLFVAPPSQHRKTGSNPPSLTDPTDMGSTWRINLRGQFGRRS